MQAPADAEAGRRAAATLHEAWLQRADRLRAVAATADEAMTSALADIGLIDGELEREPGGTTGCG